jgi:2-methylisocitrate lyase-like PEP mutase family enzyme
MKWISFHLSSLVPVVPLLINIIDPSFSCVHQADALSQPSYVQHVSPAQRLRQLVQERKEGDASIILPGAHDALSAKIFSQSGAKVIFLSGFGVSASRLGQPDVGIITQTEMEDALRSVVQGATTTITTSTTSASTSTSAQITSKGEGGCRESCIPVIVDGDTGYGGAVNIRRMIHAFSSAGAAAITIEDQVFPKKCTYAAGSGVRVVSREESLARVKAALEARDEVRQKMNGNGNGNDVLIIARTDCRAALGLEEAIARCKLFEKAGADIVYAENLQSRDEYKLLRQELNEKTATILAQVEMGGGVEQTLYSSQQVGDMGYDFALFGITALQAAVKAMQRSAELMLNPSEGEDSSSGLISGGNMDKDNDESTLTSFSRLKETIGFESSENFQSKYDL